MVAAARAVATRQPHAIINDPWAAPLVEAVGIESLSRMVQLGTPPADAGLGSDLRLQPMIDSFAVRTRFFDEFFTAATNSGIRQVVILAAGLDSRAYRLPWPHGTVIYEVDLPSVLAFKAGVFSRLGVAPLATHRPVACDLRDDWATALRGNGFDGSRPTAWSAEGLLMYLPPDAQDQLFDTITTLSAPRSRLATEYHPDSSRRSESTNGLRRSLAGQWHRHRYDPTRLQRRAPLSTELPCCPRLERCRADACEPVRRVWSVDSGR